MSTIHFITPGLLNMDDALTFGMSAKSNKDSAIGFFGTGLKFAIATLLRTGHSISVLRHSGVGVEEVISFGTTQQTVRDEVFDVVTMNGQRLAFTTQLGRLWESWMAFRELHSNTLDENGETRAGDVSDYLKTLNCDYTVISASGDGITQAYHERSSIFTDAKILDETADLEVRYGASQYLYYRGVRVYKLPKPSLFTYNLKNTTDLTEDRTLKDAYTVRWKLPRYVVKLTNEAVLHTMLKPHGACFEGDFDFDLASQPSDEFLNVVRMSSKDAALLPAARKFAQAYISHEVEDEVLNPVEQKMLDRATRHLEAVGFKVSEFGIRVVDLHGTLGMAKDSTIFISKQAFRMGTKYVAGTLFEEYIHLREGCCDETRAMQNILVDTVMSLSEQLVGEPL